MEHGHSDVRASSISPPDIRFESVAVAVGVAGSARIFSQGTESRQMNTPPLTKGTWKVEFGDIFPVHWRIYKEIANMDIRAPRARVTKLAYLRSASVHTRP